MLANFKLRRATVPCLVLQATICKDACARSWAVRSIGTEFAGMSEQCKHSLPSGGSTPRHMTTEASASTTAAEKGEAAVVTLLKAVLVGSVAVACWMNAKGFYGSVQGMIMCAAASAGHHRDKPSSFGLLCGVLEPQCASMMRALHLSC